MGINLSLQTKDQIDIIASAIKERRDSLDGQIAELQRERDGLTAVLAQIYPAQAVITEFTNTPINGYNKDWSTSKKAIYVIRKNNRPMTTAEIADVIVNDLEKGAERKHIVRNLSVLFSTQKQKFIKSVNPKGENTYMV